MIYITFKDILKRLKDILLEIQGEKIKWYNKTVSARGNFLLILSSGGYIWPIYIGEDGFSVYFPYYPEGRKIKVQDLIQVFSMDSNGNVCILNKKMYEIIREKLGFRDPKKYFEKLFHEVYNAIKEYIEARKADEMLDDFEEILKELERYSLE